MDTITVKEVAQELGVNPMKIPVMILNHTMPIGAVFREEGGKTRTVIVRERWEKWKAGKDLETPRMEMRT